MTCAFCGDPCERHKSGRLSRQQRKYCSDHCEKAAKVRKQHARRMRAKAEKELPGRLPRCTYCGMKVFTGAGRYCDDRCERLALRGTRGSNAPDIPAAMIERLFQRAKTRLRYQRVMQQSEVA